MPVVTITGPSRLTKDAKKQLIEDPTQEWESPWTAAIQWPWFGSVSDMVCAAGRE
jgi:hypothetical protein